MVSPEYLFAVNAMSLGGDGVFPRNRYSGAHPDSRPAVSQQRRPGALYAEAKRVFSPARAPGGVPDRPRTAAWRNRGGWDRGGGRTCGGDSRAHLDAVLAHLEISEVDAVLLDLGVSSHQLDSPKRGFRFSAETAEETPLDMRMDQRSGTTAADLLRRASPEQLENWFSDYADLPGARKLARLIVAARQRAPLRTAADLRAVIADARIESLRVAGQLVVLSYHSGEDRVVKHRMRDAARGCTCPPRTPVCICGGKVRLRVITRRPIPAGDAELRENPRARSARLRVAERVAEAS